MENQFFYLRKEVRDRNGNVSQHRVGAVAIDLNGNVGVSLCSDNDHFTQEQARLIAKGRLAKSDIEVWPTLEETLVEFYANRSDNPHFNGVSSNNYAAVLDNQRNQNAFERAVRMLEIEFSEF